MIADLFDRRRQPVPVVTYLFGAVCVAVSVPTMFFPSLYRTFGGFKPLESPWQRAGLAFQHGLQGLPSPVHLLFNMFLLAYCGVMAERLLGRARFTLLTVAAMAAFAVAHLCPVVDGHGASGVIWAYAPIVFVALRRAWRNDREAALADPHFQRGRGVLLIMWGAVTVVMAGLVYAMGYRGNPLWTVLLGNIFHISATAVGVAFALLWRRRIEAAVPLRPGPAGPRSGV